jgi:hypothetical protein
VSPRLTDHHGQQLGSAGDSLIIVTAAIALVIRADRLSRGRRACCQEHHTRSEQTRCANHFCTLYRSTRQRISAPEVSFTPYKTFQTSIEAIEKLTDLSFRGGAIGKPESLRRFDPLTKRVSGRTTRDGTSKEPLRELRSLDDLVLPD